MGAPSDSPGGSARPRDDQSPGEADSVHIPEPPGVENLPHDKRGIPIPIHVGRPPGQPVNITAFDQRRLILITATRRCTVCGWKIRGDELCWYPSWPPAIQQVERSGWTIWDQATEGVGHKECMIYSAVACPWLSAAPGYKRRTPQRHAGVVVGAKGTEREELVLCGMPEALLSMNPPNEVTVIVGGGRPELVPFRSGEELRPLLDGLLAGELRRPEPDDLAFVELLSSTDDKARLDMRTFQMLAEIAPEAGMPHPPMERNRSCPYGSGVKAKYCCLRRYGDSEARVRRGEVDHPRAVRGARPDS